MNNPDIDADAILNTTDPFSFDNANGTATIVTGSSNLDWSFDFGAGISHPGPDGLTLGLTGHMTNGTRDFLTPAQFGGLDLNNVKLGTAAGGGLVVVEQVSNGTASGASNNGEYLFQTGVTFAPSVNQFQVSWRVINPFTDPATRHDGQEIGGYIGTGDQDNFLKVVIGPSGSNEARFVLESHGVEIAHQEINADALFEASANNQIVRDAA